MKKVPVVISVLIILMLFFGCTGGQANVEQPPVKTPEPEKNTTTGPTPPEFKPLHLYYELTVPNPDGTKQTLKFHYYLDDKTTCSGRPVLNGFVTIAQEGQEAYYTGYLKTTIYLDTGEAVYSDRLDVNSLAFDSATAKVSEFDVAFYLPTLLALGEKKILSEEVWNASKPVLLKNIPTFGSNGDYSLITGETDRVNNFECKNFALSVKSASMEGQLLFCMHLLSNPQMAIVASVSFPMESTLVPSWELVSIDNEKPPVAYYPQCLQPISCPKVSMPTQEERNSCGLQGNFIDTIRDSRYCVTAYECISLEELARKNIIENQRPDCPVNPDMIAQAADCWDNGGSINYNWNDDGCIQSADCNKAS